MIRAVPARKDRQEKLFRQQSKPTTDAGQQPILAGAEPETVNQSARQVFGAFKANVSTNVLAELERALQELVFRYNVTNQENRFVVGLAVELLIAASMRASGTDVDNVGEKESETDFDVYAQKVRSRISVKSTFATARRPIRLVNYLGGKERKPTMVPTIFVLPGLGLTYGDSGYPTLVNGLRAEKDASVISMRAIRQHAQEHPELVVSLNVPVNTGTGTKIASRELARSIVDSHGYPSLGRWLRPEPSPRLATEVRDEIAKYQRLRDDGVLTRSEFESAKADLLRLLQSPK
jgi:hypothetical protein